jgi:outer membrane receptor protein involved in Fe transport
MLIVHMLAQAVAAAAPEAAAQQGVISYRPEFFASFQPVNAMEMIQRVPGFTFDGGDDVRGFAGAAGNVLIDGQRPAAKTDNLESILRRVPASQVERLELIRGSAPGVDMQGKTVLVNVVRKNGGGFRGLVSIANNYVVDDGRTSPAIRLEGSGGSSGRSWEASLLAARFTDSGVGDGPGVRISPTGQVQRRSAIESEGQGHEIILTSTYETPALGGRLRLNGLLRNEEYNYDEQNRISFPAPSGQFDQYGEDEKQLELGARFNRSLSARSSVEVVLLQRNEDEHFGETFREPGEVTFFTLDSKTGESIAHSVLKHRLDDRLSFEGSIEGAFNWLESETSFRLNGAPIPLPAANVRVEETRGEVSGKAVWRPEPKWTFEAGVRQEASKITSSGDVTLGKTLYFTKPRATASWAATPTTQVRARIEREVGQLDFDDFVADTSFNTGGGVQAGNPDINPEQAWVGEVALEQRFWGKGAVVLTYRHYELKDVIDSAPVFGGPGVVFDAPGNIGDGVKDEFAVSGTLPLEKLGWKGAELRGSATWRESKVTDPTTGQKREISGLRPLSWEAFFTHDLPQWRANWGVEVFGGWRETYYRVDQITDRKLKTYVELFAEYRPQPDLSVRLELTNLTERGFRNTRRGYDGPRSTSPLKFIDDRDIQVGRMVYVRVRKTFGG